jgi:hydroxymethylpyrimidine pyrophosphatase-like HAD family hydrolase
MTNPSPEVFALSDAKLQLEAQDAANRPRTALFSDIDDSFIDRAGRSEAIAAAWEIREWANATHVPIILVTGVEFAGVEPRLQSQQIPGAEVLITSVGTEIWVRQTDGTYLRDEAYAAWLAKKQFDRSAVTQAIEERLHEQPHLRLTFQGKTEPYKVSLHFFGTHAEAAAVEADYKTRFPNFAIIVCEEINYNATLPPNATEKKFCLDIAAAGKDDALAYIVGALAIKAGWKAGDSGNDKAMLLHDDPLQAIVVGGAKPELIAAAKAAQGERHIYIEQDPQLRAAQSILYVIETTDLA